MNLKDLVSKISIETSIPAAQVRKVVVAVLDSFKHSVATGEKFTSSRLNVIPFTQKTREVVDQNGVKTMTLERKLGRIIPRKQKTKSAEKEDS